jgi:hypothetical protein
VTSNKTSPAHCDPFGKYDLCSEKTLFYVTLACRVKFYLHVRFGSAI